MLCISEKAHAQFVEFDTAGLKIIKISHADAAFGSNTDNANYQRLIGAVVIEHDGFTMTCDSAHFFLAENFIEAFSNVNITKANGVNAHGEYIRYTGNNNTAFMQGNVQIIDGANSLFTEELTYNIRTKLGKYYKSGTIHTEETTLSSEEGTYNGNSQQSWFKKNVVVNNPKYSIESKELTYNIKTKVVSILDSSVIVSDNSVIRSKRGTYDSKTGNAVFTTRTRVETDEQIIEGDHMTYNDENGNATATGHVSVQDIENDSKLFADKVDYNKKTGNGKATAHVVIEQDKGKNLVYADEATYNKLNGYIKTLGEPVVIIDTEQKSKLLAGMVEFNENSKFMLATLYPKLITLADEDSLYMRSDTMLSIRTRDEKKLGWMEVPAAQKGERSRKVYNLLYADSTFRSREGDDDKSIVIAQRNVRIYSDSLQAICDSLVYSQYDSTFTLYKKPVVWSRNQQSDADTIRMFTADHKMKELHMKGNAFLLSLTGFEGYYDQVSGSVINAYFANNEVERVHVIQNAESIYYGKDDNEAYLGANKSESAEMTVFFENREVARIHMNENPKLVFTPIDKLGDTTRFLPNYRLITEGRPASKKEILED